MYDCSCSTVTVTVDHPPMHVSCTHSHKVPSLPLQESDPDEELEGILKNEVRMLYAVTSVTD